MLLNRHQNFAPALNGRYLTSNVNITIADHDGKPVDAPVGGMFRHTIPVFLYSLLSDVSGRTVHEVQD